MSNLKPQNPGLRLVFHFTFFQYTKLFSAIATRATRKDSIDMLDTLALDKPANVAFFWVTQLGSNLQFQAF